MIRFMMTHCSLNVETGLGPNEAFLFNICKMLFRLRIAASHSALCTHIQAPVFYQEEAVGCAGEI